MAVLGKQEIELPLNSGMDTKSGAEIQEATSLRNVAGLRWNKLGELEPTPTHASTMAVPASNLGSYGNAANATVSGLYTRNEEVFALTGGIGVLGIDPGGTTGRHMRRLDDVAASVNGDLQYAPCAANVSRTFAGPITNSEEGILAAATAIYGDYQLVAWLSKEQYGSGYFILHVKVYNKNTGEIHLGEIVDNVRYSPTIVAKVRAHAQTAAGIEGIVVSVGRDATVGIGAEVALYKWTAATNTFAYVSALVTNTTSEIHDMRVTSTGTVQIAYEVLSTGFLTVKTLNSAMSAVTATYTANHGGITDICMNGSTLVSIDNNDTVYAEIIGGTPATRVIIEATGATGSYYSVHIARGTGGPQTGVILVSGVDVLGTAITDEARFVRSTDYTVSGTVVVPGQTTYIPHAECVGAVRMTADGAEIGRAYAAFSFHIGSSGLSSAVLARYAAPSSTYARWDPIARVCHDRLTLSNAVSGWTALSMYASIEYAGASDKSLYMALPVDGTEYNKSQSVMLPRIDLSPIQASCVDMGDGSTVFGHGLLASYDGSSVVEAQPLHPPRISLDTTYPAGFRNGVFGIIAVYSYVDAAGNVHRSEPSEPLITPNLVNQEINLYISVPALSSFSRYTPSGYTYSIKEIKAEVYITEAGGSVYYFRGYAAGTTARDCWFDYLNVSAGDPSKPAVYTTQSGDSELASQPPPAFRHLTRIGDRLWGVDAEDRTRIWFTKPLVSGFAPEWNTVCTLNIGDRCVGISDVNGVPTVFTERGIWQIYGDGPNALGVGSFAPARKLQHEIECMDAMSICRTNAGIFFRARRGVYLLDPGLALNPIGLSVSPDMVFSGSPPLALNETNQCLIVADEMNDEVHVLDYDQNDNGYGNHYLFNMTEGKWSKWDGPTSDGFQSMAVLNGSTWFTLDDDTIRRLYSTNESGIARPNGWVIETPWLRFDGTTGMSRIWEVVIQVRLGESDGTDCGGKIKVTYTTRDGQSDTFTWQPADLHALKDGQGTATVNLRCQVTDQRARQFKITMDVDPAAYAYTGHVPISMRVIYGTVQNGGRKRHTGQTRGSTI